MFYLVIRILGTALALAITVILAPGLHIEPLLPGVIDISATYIIFGIVFGLINAFVRPAVLLFTARLLVRTMGWFAIVINAFLFWLLELIAPKVFIVQQPMLIWIVFAGTIMAIVVMVMEALFGLDKPEMTSRTETQLYWRWVRFLSTGRRNMIAENLRTAQILDIISRYTKDIAVEMSPLARFRSFMQELIFQDQDQLNKLSNPERVRYMLQELGPTFVKFGQIVSSRADALPPEWKQELDRLQSNVPPFSYERAEQIIFEELGDTPENLFAEFEKQPFAAASTAQVHKAKLNDGSEVVVKIQRPNIDVTVKADLNVMRDLTKSIQKRQEWAQAIDLRGLVNEYADSILYELDYRNEAANVLILSINLEQFQGIHLPTIYPEFSTSKVLTMEFLSGVKINNLESIDAAGLDRAAMAKVLVQAMTKQVLFDGFFHADPHPGNAIVNLETGQIGFLDMGLMGELNRKQRMALADLMVSIRDGDGYSLGKAALRITTPLPGKKIDEGTFLEDMDRFGQRYLRLQAADFSTTFSALQDILKRTGLRLHPDMVLAFKTLVQAEEVIHTLNPTIDITTSAVESAVLIGREAITSEALAQTVSTQISRSAREVMYRLPNLVDATTKWLDQYEKGRLSMHIDTSDLGVEVTKLDKALTKGLDRLIIGLILTGWLIGSAIASTIDVNLMGIQLSSLAFYMFVIGAAISGFVVVQAITRLNREEDEF